MDFFFFLGDRLLNGGVGWEELVPHKEDEVHEGMELDCYVVAGALGVFAQSEAEVEAQGEQIGDLTSLVLEEKDAAATMEWIMPSGTAFYRFIGGSSRPYVLSCRVRHLSSQVWAWASGGFLGSRRPSRRWITAIAPHA